MKKEKDLKPVYEAPKVFRLDETDSMFGICEVGNKDSSRCAQGNDNPGEFNCENGSKNQAGVCENGGQNPNP